MVELPEGGTLKVSWGEASGGPGSFLAKYGEGDYNIITAADLIKLGYTGTDDASVAMEEITGFYRNYHSLRFVEGNLILRVQHAPDDEQLAALNATFGDIVAKGEITKAGVIHRTLSHVEWVDARQIEGSVKGANYVQEISPRLRGLIDG